MAKRLIGYVGDWMIFENYDCDPDYTGRIIAMLTPDRNEYITLRGKDSPWAPRGDLLTRPSAETLEAMRLFVETFAPKGGLRDAP